MTSMAFSAKGIGYQGLSVSSFLIGINRDGAFQLYRWAGTGGTTVVTDCTTFRSFEIPADSLPQDMGGMTVRLKTEAGVYVYGTTQVTFEVYSPNRSDAVYSVTRRPQVTGLLVGGMDGLGSLKRLRRVDWTSKADVAVWWPFLVSVATQLGFYHPQSKFGRYFGLVNTVDFDDLTQF